MYSCSKFMFWFLKLCGLAPIHWHINEYHFSIRNFLLNLLFLVFIISVGMHALFSDFKNTIHGKSVRMKTRTAIVVTFVQICLTMVVIASGIIGAAFNHRKILKIERLLNQVDEVLVINRDYKWILLTFCYILLHQMILISVDICFWFTLTPYSWSYAICYVYSVICTASEMQFALICWSIRGRFCDINRALAANFKRRQVLYTIMQKPKEIPITISAFQGLHWSLCKTIQIANNAFGWQLLTSVLYLCAHIIVTPYFLLLDLFYPAAYGSADMGFLLLQVAWIITHHIHLFLIVIPASAASDEARRAAVIICENLHVNITATELKQLEIFVLQLKKFTMEFSASGLFYLQRPVITSVIGSVVTYLVILIQFQNSDKIYH